MGERLALLELHGRDDCRTRSSVFVQIAILRLLAVFTAGAATTDGAPFAIVYAAFLDVMTWLGNRSVARTRRSSSN